MSAQYTEKPNEGDMETVGQRLQILQDAASRRRGKRVSNREIARKLEISPATWGDWLQEEVELAERQHYIDIAELFQETYGVPTNWKWIRDGDSAAVGEPLSHEVVYQIMEMGRERCREKGMVLDDHAQAHLVCLAYGDSMKRGEVSRAFVNAQVDALARKK